MRIFIDPGHGGKNTGVHVGTLIEKNYTLQLAIDLREALGSLYKDVELSRHDDDYVMLRDRFVSASNFGADVAVSIHVNAAQHKGLKGLMVFANDSEAANFGTEIMMSAPPTIRRREPKTFIASPNDWTKRAHNCLEGYKCPAVLVECFFASNAKDLAFGQSRAGRRAIVSGIASGIANYDSNLWARGFGRLDGSMLCDAELECGGSIRG
tara:strand:- start:150 stop:779 length:630 start_codon:yes stop_codon:yes gene_type:complete